MNRRLRTLPLLAIPAVVVAGAIALPAMASASPKLDTKTPQQVLAMIADAKNASYSGEVQQTSDLGLPQLPSSATGSGASSADSSASNVLDLLTGTHRIRVYADGATKQRVQVLDQLAERDVIRNGSTVWTWDSKARKATKVTLPAASDAAKKDASVTPSTLAEKLVAAAGSTTTLKVDETATVAGRSAYQLTLTPKSGTTLVKDVVLSVDAKSGLPLKVQVDATGQKVPAFTIGYTSITFGAPDAKLFDFSAPSGATVTTRDLSTMKHPDHVTHGPVGQDPDANRPTTVGTGWSRILVLPAGTGSKLSGADAQRLLGELTTPVTGGRALQSSLVSVFIADDGRVLVGSVPLSALQAAAG